MTLRILASIILFIGSYFPLSLILLVQNLKAESYCIPWRTGCSWELRQPYISLYFVAICIFCVAATLVVLSAVRTDRAIDTVETKHIPVDLMNYVLPYVVSFMGIDYGDTGKFLGFIVFLLWMFIITHSSERIIMNPVLVVFGWKLYEIKYKTPGGELIQTKVALSRQPLDPGCRYKLNTIQDVLIVK